MLRAGGGYSSTCTMGENGFLAAHCSALCSRALLRLLLTQQPEKVIIWVVGSKKNTSACVVLLLVGFRPAYRAQC